MSVQLHSRSPFEVAFRLTTRRNKHMVDGIAVYDETDFDCVGDFYPLLGEQAVVLDEGNRERVQYGVQLQKSDLLSLQVDDIVTHDGVRYLVRKVLDWVDFWEAHVVLPVRPV